MGSSFYRPLVGSTALLSVIEGCEGMGIPAAGPTSFTLTLPSVPPTPLHSGPLHLEINGDSDPESEEDVKNHGIDEEFSEVEVFGRSASEAVNRIDDGGVHFPLIRAQRVRARSESGSVTILILLTPDWRKVSMTLAKVPKGMVSSARRNTESCGFLSCAAT